MRDEDRYKLLKLLNSNPEATQRELASQLGISVGKVNYCLAALIEKGQIRVHNFTNSNNKAAYIYKLTPQGIEDKARITLKFLKRKIREYEQIQEEIAQLRREAAFLGLNVKE